MEKNHEELKKSLALIQEELKRTDLSQEDRAKFENTSAKIAGYLLSSWLPSGVFRKILLLVLLVGAVYNLIHGSFISVIILLFIASMFSPRVMGEIFYTWGKTRSNN